MLGGWAVIMGMYVICGCWITGWVGGAAATLSTPPPPSFCCLNRSCRRALVAYLFSIIMSILVSSSSTAFGIGVLAGFACYASTWTCSTSFSALCVVAYCCSLSGSSTANTGGACCCFGISSDGAGNLKDPEGPSPLSALSRGYAVVRLLSLANIWLIKVLADFVSSSKFSVLLTVCVFCLL